MNIIDDFDFENIDICLKSTNNTNDNIYELIDKLNSKFDFLVFGGSFGLELYEKLRKRKINDIDLIFSYNDKSYKEIIKYLNESNFTLSNDSSGVECASGVYEAISWVTPDKNIKIDLIRLYSTIINYNTVKGYRVQFLNEIIKAKQELILNNKHTLDLNYILENLK